MENNQTELCVISVLFPSPNDSFAISVKQKIKELLADIPEARIDFSIGDASRPIPTMPPTPRS